MMMVGAEISRPRFIFHDLSSDRPTELSPHQPTRTGASCCLVIASWDIRLRLYGEFRRQVITLPGIHVLGPNATLSQHYREPSNLDGRKMAAG